LSLVRRIHALSLIPFLLLLAFPASSFPQNKPSDSAAQTPTIKVRTELVMIPTEVTDAKGNRVTDMKKEDFAVFENGKRQEIALFEHVTTNAEVTEPVAVPEGVFTNRVQKGTNRITILVVDLLNSRMEEQKEARKQILDFLLKLVDQKEPISLFVVNAQGAWLVHGFTSDPKVLVEALNQVKTQASENDRPVKNPEEQLYKTVAGWHTHNAAENVASEGMRIDMLTTSVGFQDMDANARIRMTLMSLLEIADACAGIPGRKSMIWATAGFPFAVNEAATFGKAGTAGGGVEHALLPLYEQAWRALEAANIAVYPLDVSELTNPGYASAGMGESLPQRVMMDTHVANLEGFADATGGKFCDRGMDAKKCFEQAAGDSSDYYLLGIYDKSGAEKPGWRSLSVRTPRSGMQIRARNGYYLTTAAHEAPSDTNLLQMALYSPFDYTGLPVSVKFLETMESSKPGGKLIRFEYAIPGGAIQVGDENGNQLNVEFAAVARDSTGKPAGSFSKMLQGKLSEAQEAQMKAKGLVFRGQLELGPGEYALSFAVIDKVNENTGSVTAPLKVE
jgi:VWFA-related protein